ncbi:Uncharacterised protein [Klebsiella pneumoniae]|nr:Uncharacterised protein [Klebsiella pneumoniae]
MLFQPLGVIFRRNKNPPFIHSGEDKEEHAGEQIEHHSVQYQHPDAFQHLIHRHRIDNTQG